MGLGGHGKKGKIMKELWEVTRENIIRIMIDIKGEEKKQGEEDNGRERGKKREKNKL